MVSVRQNWSTCLTSFPLLVALLCMYVLLVPCAVTRSYDSLKQSLLNPLKHQASIFLLKNFWNLDSSASFCTSRQPNMNTKLDLNSFQASTLQCDTTEVVTTRMYQKSMPTKNTCKARPKSI